MFSGVTLPVSVRPIPANPDDLAFWANKETQPLLRQLREYANSLPPVINARDFGASPDRGRTNNVGPFNRAIAVANAQRVPLYVPDPDIGGEYWFTSDEGLDLIDSLTGCPGYIGGPSNPILKWSNRDGDCMRFNGPNLKISNLFVQNNRTDDMSARSACIRITNCAYGFFTRLSAFLGAKNGSGVMLEQMWDGSTWATYLLDHIGAWYNTFIGTQVTYIGLPSQVVGYGLDLYLNPNAIGVPGHGTGQIASNIFINQNIEGMRRGINLDHANKNMFLGGQLGGGKDAQIYASNSSNNVLSGISFVQWTGIGGKALAFDGTCQANKFEHLIFSDVTPQPWTIGDGTLIGTLGNAPTWISGSDGIAWDSPIFRDGILSRHDAHHLVDEVDAADTVISSDVIELKSTDGTNPAQLWLSQNGTLRLTQPFGNSGVLKVDDDVGTGGKLWVTSGQLLNPAGSGAAVVLGNGYVQAFGTWAHLNSGGTFNYLGRDGFEANTADATPQNVATVAVTDNTACSIEFRVTARRTGGARGTGAVNDYATFYRTVSVVKNGTGATAATSIGGSTPVADQASADLTAGGIAGAIVLGGAGAVSFQATGVAGVNLRWRITTSIVAQS